MPDLGFYPVSFNAQQYRQFRDQLDPLKGSLQAGIDWQPMQQTEVVCSDAEAEERIINLGNNDFNNVWQLRRYFDNAPEHCKAKNLLEIIALLNSPNQQKKADAAAVLCGIWSGDYALLLDSEYIPQLIRALDDHDLGVKRDIIRALSSAAVASRDVHNQRKIVRELFREFKLHPELRPDIKEAMTRMRGLELPLLMRIEVNNICHYSPY